MAEDAEDDAAGAGGNYGTVGNGGDFHGAGQAQAWQVEVELVAGVGPLAAEEAERPQQVGFDCPSLALVLPDGHQTPGVRFADHEAQFAWLAREIAHGPLSGHYACSNRTTDSS